MILCLFSQFRELMFGETFLLQVEVKTTFINRQLKLKDY